MHWSEEMVFEGKNNNLFKKSITHQELLGGTTHVSVSVLDSHTGESGLLNLDGYVLGQIQVDLDLSGWVNTWVHGGGEDVETLVSDFVDHFIFININYIQKIIYQVYFIKTK